jgi:hypothetical protein
MAQYTTVLANEFNSVRNTVANVLGTGSGDRGYGSPVTSYQVAVGGAIGPAEYNALKTDINVCYTHINNGTATLNSIVSGNQITWANLVSYQVAATFIDNNRSGGGGPRSNNSSNSTTLPAGWGNASGNRIATMNGTVNFASAEAMRFYYNQGCFLSLAGSGNATTGGTPKSNAFGTLANGAGVNLNLADYRAGTGTSNTQTTGVNPYAQGTADTVSVSFGAPSGSTISFTIQLIDKGNDGNVASNVGIALTFYMSLVNISASSGITTYTPSVSFGSWSYSG